MEPQILKGHSELVSSVAFSRDGQRIISGSYDKSIKLWDA
ncbi:MAG: WD40 domain-containing protein [Kocuria palustris]|nr:WD40 domain-containing protein [Kocuria palustris]